MKINGKDTAQAAIEQLAQATSSTGGSLKSALSKFANKSSMQALLGIDQKTAEGIYGQAFRHYSTGKYDDAIQLFQLLVVYDGEDPRFMMGLASCYHMKKDFDSAVQFYTSCGILDPQDPLPHYHLSDCYLQMGAKISAVVALQMAVNRAGDKEEFAIMKERALMAIQTYKRELMRPQQL